MNVWKEFQICLTNFEAWLSVKKTFDWMCEAIFFLFGWRDKRYYLIIF
jgi:hypothetical protein